MSSLRCPVSNSRCLLASALIGLLAATASAQLVNIETVHVGNPGNAGDTRSWNDGAVGYEYDIGKYDVTAAQYTAFLNAVAKTDTYGLYDPRMNEPVNLNPTTVGCGILQSGSPGNYTYTTTKNPNYPVNYVTYWDACRFANWLQNGQPTGAQGAGTTETGAYTLTAAGITANTIARNPNATWAVPTQSEWHKAAYYDPALNNGSGGYWLYTTRSNTQPGNFLPDQGNSANIALNGNYADPVNLLSPVGAYSASASAYGTFDEGGDVYQWNEAILGNIYRGLQGGAFNYTYRSLQSGNSETNCCNPTYTTNYIGFRVVGFVPEPASLSILALGTAALLTRRHRRRH